LGVASGGGKGGLEALAIALREAALQGGWRHDSTKPEEELAIRQGGQGPASMRANSGTYLAPQDTTSNTTDEEKQTAPDQGHVMTVGAHRSKIRTRQRTAFALWCDFYK